MIIWFIDLAINQFIIAKLSPQFLVYRCLVTCLNELVKWKLFVYCNHSSGHSFYGPGFFDLELQSILPAYEVDVWNFCIGLNQNFVGIIIIFFFIGFVSRKCGLLLWIQQCVLQVDLADFLSRNLFIGYFNNKLPSEEFHSTDTNMFKCQLYFVNKEKYHYFKTKIYQNGDRKRQRMR